MIGDLADVGRPGPVLGRRTDTDDGAAMTTDQSPELGSDELLSVLIADDEAVVRETLSIYIDSAPDMQVVGTAADGRAAVQMAETLRPDIILMDVQVKSMLTIIK